MGWPAVLRSSPMRDRGPSLGNGVSLAHTLADYADVVAPMRAPGTQLLNITALGV
jgi:hypothetical protein